MKQLFTSATKIVLLMLILTLCYLAIRQLSIAPEFKDITLMVVSFYFGGKMTPPKNGDNSIVSSEVKG